MRIVSGTLAVFLFAVPAFAQLAGSWDGSYTAISIGCQPSVPHGGSMTVTIAQNGSSISGTLSIEVFLFDCQTAGATASAPSQSVVASFTGTASADTFTATFPAGPSGTGTMTGTLQGDELVITFVAGDTSGTARAARQGTAAEDVSGTWRGAYSAVATWCTPPVAMTGLVTAEFAQTGDHLQGVLSIHSPYSDCAPDPRDASVRIDGTVTGRSFEGSFDATPTRAWPIGNIRGSLHAGELIVSVVSGDTTGTAVLSKPATRRHAVVRH